MVEEPLVTAFEQLNTTEKTPIIKLNNVYSLSDVVASNFENRQLKVNLT